MADAPDLGSGAFGCGGSTPPSRTFKLLAVASKKSTISSCPVTRGEIDLSKYEKLDGAWRALGISAPARRALVDAKLLKLSDLRTIKLEDLKALHGMGPKTVKTLIATGAKFKK